MHRKSKRFDTGMTQVSINNGLKSHSQQWRSWLTRRGKELLWTVFFGSLFIATHSSALSLKNLQVNSVLGQPFDAIVHVSAAPGEVLSASCISIREGADAALPPIHGVRLSLSRTLNPGTIRLRSSQPMNEPMSEMVIQVACEGAPKIQRSFLVMLDPPGTNTAVSNAQTTGAKTNSPFNTQGGALPAQIADTPNNRRLVPQAAPTQTNLIPTVTSDDARVRVASSRVARINGATIQRGINYVVSNGESLSTIAARIENRDRGSVWSWAATIQAANPQAFINGNPNELIAGSSLYVPNSLTRTADIASLGNSTVTRSTATTERRASSRDTTSAAALQLEESMETTERAERIGEITEQSASTLAQPAIGMQLSEQPRFVMARRFSALSLARLDQRSAGLIQAIPEGLPDFIGSDETQEPKQELPEEPVPVSPADRKPEMAAISATNNNNRRFSWLSILGGLGLLALSFLAGLWFAGRRTQSTMQEMMKARLNEERYFERVRSDRKHVTEEVLGRDDNNGIEVREAPSIDTSFDPMGDMPEQPLSTADSSELEAQSSNPEEVEFEIAPAQSGAQQTDAMQADLNIDIGQTADQLLSNGDLELLEQDYARSTSTTTDLENIAAAGQGAKPNDQTELIESKLDLEFPGDVGAPQEEDGNTVDFPAIGRSLDFDIGGTGSFGGAEEAAENTSDEFDLSNIGAELDAELQSMEDAEQAAEATTVEQEVDINEEEDNPEFQQTSTRDSEEFYHLEASSIMNVGELSFEKDLDDETKILKFRQRGMKTGTDDSGSDDS